MCECRLNRSCLKDGLCLLTALAVVCVSGCGTHVAGVPAASTGGGGQAQPRVVSAPVLGYAWDATAGVLRQIDGVPGAARVDAAANTGDGFALAVAASSHDYALLLDAKGALYQATLPGGVPQKISAGPWSGVAISASGGYAVAYSDAGTVPQLISGLPQMPVFHSVDAQGMGISAAAVGDDGTALLAAHAGSGGGTAVLTVPMGGSAVRAMTVGSAAGMAFVPGTDRALVADAASGAVTQIASASSAPAVSVVSGAKLGQPVGLAVSADGRWAMVANASGTVMRIDLSGQAQPATAKCGCSPTAVANLSGAAFRLTEVGSATGWLADANGAGLRVLFVPALPQQKTTGGGL